MGRIQGSWGDQLDTDSSQQWPLGQELMLPDGRLFKYTLNDAVAEAAGSVYQSALPIANHLNVTCNVARAAGAVQISATLGATAAAVDLYAEGYVNVNDQDGVGHMYKVQRAYAAGDGHAYVSSAGVITVNLAPRDSVQVALTTSSQITLIPHESSTVIIHPSPPTAGLNGVAVVAAAASAYYWAQVRGMCSVLTQGTLVIGDHCVVSATVDGAVMPSAALETDGPIVGRVHSVNANGEHSGIFLTLA